MSSGEPETGSRRFEPPKPIAEMAAEVAALLGAAAVQFALAEAGTGGELARLLSASQVGAALTRGRLFRSAEELAIALRVSPAKVDAFGAFSAMVAAEAAADLIDTYEGGWGLVVMAPLGNSSIEPSVQSKEAMTPECFVALGTPSTTIIQRCGSEDLSRTVLALLAQQARRRLERA